jgi:hypothetical protein
MMQESGKTIHCISLYMREGLEAENGDRRRHPHRRKAVGGTKVPVASSK